MALNKIIMKKQSNKIKTRSAEMSKGQNKTVVGKGSPVPKGKQAPLSAVDLRFIESANTLKGKFIKTPGATQ